MRNIFKVLRLAPTANISWLLIFSFLLALLAVSNVVYPYLYGLFFESLVAKETKYLTYLYYILGYFALFSILQIMLTYWQTKVTEQVGYDIEMQLNSRFLDLDRKLLDKKGEGYFTTLMDQSIFYILNFLHPYYIETLLTVFKMPVILWFIFSVHTPSGALILGWMLLYLLTFRSNQKHYGHLLNASIEARNHTNSLVIKRLSLNELSKLYPSIRQSFLRDMQNICKLHQEKSFRSNLYAGITHPLISLHLEPFLRIGVLFAAGNAAYQGSISIGQLVTLVAYFFLIREDMQKISAFIDGYVRCKESSANIMQFLQDQKISSPRAGSEKYFLEFQDFSYLVKQQTRQLPKVNAQLPLGQIYSLTGPNGMGKSTLIKIITGQYKQYKGAILGPEKINYISQDYLIIDDYSVQDNIILKTELDEPCLAKIVADLDIDYLMQKPSIGKFSGGEKRKIILARFLYYLKDHNFFIFDEVFVSLDRDYLKNILPVIKSYIKGKTGIVISHNLSVIETLCDNNTLDSLLEDYLTEE